MLSCFENVWAKPEYIEFSNISCCLKTTLHLTTVTLTVFSLQYICFATPKRIRHIDAMEATANIYQEERKNRANDLAKTRVKKGNIFMEATYCG